MGLLKSRLHPLCDIFISYTTFLLQNLKTTQKIYIKSITCNCDGQKNIADPHHQSQLYDTKPCDIFLLYLRGDQTMEMVSAWYSDLLQGGPLEARHL